jgi:uncharacterized Tic20 family protein
METDDTKQEKQTVKPDDNAAAGPSKDERMWAMFCHLIALAGYVVPIPFASVVGPLVLWLIKKDGHPFVDDQGKEAVNFQISISIYVVVASLMIFILIGIPLVVALVIFHLVCVIIAAVKANEGVHYRYPLCIRFIK